MRLNEKEELALRKLKTTIEEVLAGNPVEVKLFTPELVETLGRILIYDVLVIISSGNWRMRDIIYDIATDVLLETEVCISPKVINRGEYEYFSNIGAPFIKNIIREGITV